MATSTFTPAYTPNADAIIKACPDDTLFIMEQRQPEKFYDPEDMDLQPHCIRNKGTYQEMIKIWESLEAKIKMLHASEEIELFSRGEGNQYTDCAYTNMVVFKGTDVITLTLCTKKQALALSL